MRLVDTDGDGRADRYTTFADVDSPRGVVVDGKTVYVLHPPNLTAYRDTNGDGIADDSTDLVKGTRRRARRAQLRPLDEQHHVRPRRLDLRRGRRLRVRARRWARTARRSAGTAGTSSASGPTARGSRSSPSARGTSTTSAIDPFGHVFTRDNTNDGGGWDTRLHYLAPNANMGYPSLFQPSRRAHADASPTTARASGTAGCGSRIRASPTGGTTRSTPATGRRTACSTTC